MKNIFLLCVVALLLISCSKKEDSNTSEITITNVKINGESISESTEEPVLHAGDNFKVDVAYTSNLNTTELKFEIHNNFNGHQHEHDHARLLAEEGKDTLSYSQVISLGDREGEVTVYNNVIPDNIAEGEYHMEIMILDVEGGSAESVYSIDIHEDHDAHEEEEEHEEHHEDEKHAEEAS